MPRAETLPLGCRAAALPGRFCFLTLETVSFLQLGWYPEWEAKPLSSVLFHPAGHCPQQLTSAAGLDPFPSTLSLYHVSELLCLVLLSVLEAVMIASTDPCLRLAEGMGAVKTQPGGL